MKGAPSTGTGGALPAGDEEAIFKDYDLTGAANKAAAIAQGVIGHRPLLARRGGFLIRRGVSPQPPARVPAVSRVTAQPGTYAPRRNN